MLARLCTLPVGVTFFTTIPWLVVYWNTFQYNDLNGIGYALVVQYYNHSKCYDHCWTYNCLIVISIQAFFSKCIVRLPWFRIITNWRLWNRVNLQRILNGYILSASSTELSDKFTAIQRRCDRRSWSSLYCVKGWSQNLGLYAIGKTWIKGGSIRSLSPHYLNVVTAL